MTSELTVDDLYEIDTIFSTIRELLDNEDDVPDEWRVELERVPVLQRRVLEQIAEIKKESKR